MSNVHTAPTMQRRWRTWLAALHHREDGIAMTEYVTLLMLVTLGGAAAVVALGIPLLRLYKHAQILLALPVP